MGISAAISFLIGLVVILIVVYCLYQAASMFPSFPTPIRNIIVAIICLILLGLLLGYSGIAPGLRLK